MLRLLLIFLAFAVINGEHGERHLPGALIMGVKKGGTRALLTFMKMHPDVQAPGPEVHYFDKNYHRGLEWYRSRMPVSVDGQVTMEKTPGYLVHPLAPQRVFHTNSSMKLILVVRDPVTRLISDYTQAVDNANKSGKSIPSLESLTFLANTNQTVVDTSWPAIRVGLYCKHLANWYNYFPKNQILVVSGEELVRNPANILSQVQKFLNLPVLVTSRHFYLDRRKGFPCMKKSGRGGRPRCLDKNKGRKHPAVHPNVVKSLREFYHPYNQQFHTLTGFNFGWNQQL